MLFRLKGGLACRGSQGSPSGHSSWWSGVFSRCIFHLGRHPMGEIIPKAFISLMMGVYFY